ncbi:MAG: hypothetical protein B7X93_03780 [Hydrogenophilales bacterium 17-61-9]|nr:MAG: hypothetical protein B7X93_03780 [Hydrogenophilales bacterium 17-61-9]
MRVFDPISPISHPISRCISPFREGRLSSGMAANWLGVPRAHFLLKAMRTGGANLLEKNEDDFLREIALTG